MRVLGMVSRCGLRGDPWNGYRAEKDEFLSLGEAAEWAAVEGDRALPEHELAKSHGRNRES